MAAPQVTEYPGQIPLRTQDQTTFSTNTGALLTWWPTSVVEMNTALDFVDDKSNEAETLSTSAASISNSIISAANFKGEWSSLTGALTVPSTVYHSGTYWQLLDDIADVTLSEPTLINTDWALSAQSAGRVVIQSPFTLVQTGRYFVLGSDTITIPDPATLPDGAVFDFVREAAELPTIDAGTNNVTTRLGLTDGIIMGLSQSELIVRNGLYEV